MNVQRKTNESKKIYIVDDDMAVRDALKTVFELEGYEALLFESGDEMLENHETYGDHPILLDVQLPGSSGIDVLNALQSQKYEAPIFMISGQGNIPIAVSAMKAGAYDFLEKPFNGTEIVSYVNSAVSEFPSKTEEEMVEFDGANRLTPREREVLQLVAGGASNKEAGRELGISPRTVEVHRARIMEKLGAKNAAELVRIVLGR